MEISKEDALKWFGQLDENVMKKIYKTYYKRVKKPEIIVATPTTQIDKTTDKYNLLLKFTNAILNNIDGKSQITDLTEFVNISREDVIKDANEKMLDKMEEELFKIFDKYKIGYYRRTENSVLSYLRGMCRDIGLSLIITKKEVCEKINGRVYRRTGYFYTIKNI